METYTPNIHNVLALRKWAYGLADGRTAKMSWCSAMTQYQAKRFLTSCLDRRLAANAPISGTISAYPEKIWRKLSGIYQAELWRDAQVMASLSSNLSVWGRRLHTPELIARLGREQERRYLAA